MKKYLIAIAVLVLGLMLAGCSPNYQAIYLRTDDGPIFQDEDLANRTEIKVVKEFRELKGSVRKPVAIWIDKNAVQEIPQGWLKESPQKDYPVVLVGYNEPVYIFGTLLPVDFPWPKSEEKRTDLPPGFSVWKKTGADTGFIKGYENLDVDKLLEVTNTLLANQIPVEE